MSQAEAINIQGVNAAIQLAFDNWTKKSRRAYLWTELGLDARNLVAVALEELTVPPYALKPGMGGFEQWWATEHNRFCRKIKQKELTIVRELLYFFLSAFARGELGELYANKVTRKKLGKVK